MGFPMSEFPTTSGPRKDPKESGPSCEDTNKQDPQFIETVISLPRVVIVTNQRRAPHGAACKAWVKAGENTPSFEIAIDALTERACGLAYATKIPQNTAFKPRKKRILEQIGHEPFWVFWDN